MKEELKEFFNRFVANASERDIPKIAQNLAAMCRGPIQKAWGDVQALWAMIKDPDAAWKSKTVAIGALLYLVSPIDLIPDVVPVFGLTDDASVIAAAVASLSFELKKYRVQVLGQLPAPDNQPPPVQAHQQPQLADNSVEFRLKQLDALLESKIITQAEYDAKRQQILSEL
ncbi:MAG TPA: DUF1232 domain-containing protein [Verrucomicrobiae bacterium]|nr:DUF1232 domain-containing protein [Verrucomicrobiae bacterium]